MPLVDKKFYLDGKTLTVQDIDLIVENNLKIDLTQQAWENVKKSRQAIEHMMTDKNKVVYGINTGFGNFADKIISFQQRSKLQNNLVRSHAVCVGKPLPLKTVKRMMILRINTLSKARSGIQPENLQKYIQACNLNYLPMIPEKGTVGASGDLAPLSHLALGMMGQGLAWSENEKNYKNANEIMNQLKLHPIVLRQKEGLALINGTQFMTAIISEVWVIGQRLLESAQVILAFCLQIFGVQSQIISKELIEYYKQQQMSMGLILQKIKSHLDSQISQLHRDRLKRNISKPSSILNSFQSLSALYQALEFCRKIINQEMNSSTDNPLVYGKEDGFQTDVLVSAGNFHGQYPAKSADFISMGFLTLGKFSEARIQKYVNQRISGLPGFLAIKGGLNSGYMIIQYTSAALLSQSKCLSKPASADSISTSASQEDHVSMGGYPTRKCRTILENISYILGIQFMCALQSVDIINKKPSQKLSKIHQAARKYIQFIQQDKYFGPQIEIAKDLVQKGLSNII